MPNLEEDKQQKTLDENGEQKPQQQPKEMGDTPPAKEKISLKQKLKGYWEEDRNEARSRKEQRKQRWNAFRSVSLKERIKNKAENVKGQVKKGINEFPSRTLAYVKRFPVGAKKVSKRWFIDAFTGMAQGLFVTLIAGTIIKQLGTLIGAETAFGATLIAAGKVASSLMGAGIGAGIAMHLKASKLVVFSCVVAGFFGAFFQQFYNLDAAQFVEGGQLITTISQQMLKGLPGNPIGAYICALTACELCKLVAGKTKLDILIVPAVAIGGALAGTFITVPFDMLIALIADGIEIATGVQPILMGIIIACVMGVLLTLPTSSAAIWVMIAGNSTSDIMLIAGGAAVVGCAAQMVGFAVMSFKENGFSGLISQGIGTSMLQIPNIMRKPILLLPPVIASAVVGPLATSVFQLKCGSVGGGMGTSGFVGIIDTIAQSSGMDIGMLVGGILVCFFVLPAIISIGVLKVLKFFRLVKEGDLKLPD